MTRCLFFGGRFAYSLWPLFPSAIFRARPPLRYDVEVLAPSGTVGIYREDGGGRSGSPPPEIEIESCTRSVWCLQEIFRGKKVSHPLFPFHHHFTPLESQMATPTSKGRVLLAYSGGLGQFIRALLASTPPLRSLPGRRSVGAGRRAIDLIACGSGVHK